MIGVIAKLKVKSGSEAQFETLANELVSKSRAEPGSKGYTLWRTDDPTIYIFVEYYEDADGAQAHTKSDHYRQIGRELGPLIDGRPEVIRLAGATS